MTRPELITLIGIGLTFIVGLINLYVTFRNAKKTSFINNVTASRIKYIQQLREGISRFCALAYSYNNREAKLPDEELWALHKEADTLKYSIKLYLNPEDEYWDNKIMQLIDQILLTSDKDPKPHIDDLILIIQYLLKLEWEGAKMESSNGEIKSEEKDKLYKKYVEKHKTALANK